MAAAIRILGSSWKSNQFVPVCTSVFSVSHGAIHCQHLDWIQLSLLHQEKKVERLADRANVSITASPPKQPLKSHEWRLMTLKFHSLLLTIALRSHRTMEGR